jgi:signal transduction histidine kinase
METNVDTPAWKTPEDTPSAAERLNSVVTGSRKNHIAILDRYGTIVAVNMAWSRFAHENEVRSSASVGVGVSYLRVCRQAAEALDPIARQALEGIEAVLDGACEDFRLEYPCHAPSTVRWFEMTVTPLRSPNGVAIVMHTDITARRQSEAALEERLRFETLMTDLSATFGKVPDKAVPKYIQNGLRQVAEFLGIDRSTLLEFSEDQTHLHAIHWYAVPGIPPYPANALARFAWLTTTLRGGQIVCFSRPDELPVEAWAEKESCLRTGCKSSLIIPLMIDGRVRYAITFTSFHAERTWSDELMPRLQLVGEIFANAMSRKRSAEATFQLQQELVHVTRVEMMGELGTTLAHELSRPLAAILSNAQAASRFLTMEPLQLGEVQEALDDVLVDTRRAAELLQRLRALAKKTNLKRAVFDMNELIREVIQLVRGVARARKVALKLELQDGLPPVCGDCVQLQQVVLNLVLNAFEAITEAGDKPREIVVCTLHKPPMAVTVSVRDSGIGLKDETLRRMFDPFFSTKADGMGMGLAISRSIITMHDGRIWATPRPSRGTTVSFSLPTGCKETA